MTDIPSRTLLVTKVVPNRFLILLIIILCLPTVSLAELVSSVLPTSRAILLGNSATAFATVINTGPGTAIGCYIHPTTAVPADFLYQTTDPATNVTIGTVNTPVNIAEGKAQTFLFAFTPTKVFSPTEIALDFGCQNKNSANSVKGINTILLSSSNKLVPDIISIPSQTSHFVEANNGDEFEVFSIATANVGSKGSITIKQDLSSSLSPISFKVCQTAPSTGKCVNPVKPASSTTTFINAGDTPTFSIFAKATDSTSLDLVNNRVFVKFTDSKGVKRGTTNRALSLTESSSVSNVNEVVDVNGIWRGEIKNKITNSSYSIYAQLLVNNKIRILNTTDDGFQSSGTYNINGSSLSASVDNFIYSSSVAKINAAYLPKESINGSFNISSRNQSGEIRLTYLNTSTINPNNSFTAGSTNLLGSTGNIIGSLSFSKSGVISGSDNKGCVYSGSAKIIQADAKLASISIKINYCGTKNGEYFGLAKIDQHSKVHDLSLYPIK